MAKGAWWAMVHGAAKSQRQFKRLVTEQYFLEHRNQETEHVEKDLAYITVSALVIFV